MIIRHAFQKVRYYHSASLSCFRRVFTNTL
jgi:hypothetical protein